MLLVDFCSWQRGLVLCLPSPELRVRKPIRLDRSASWFLFRRAVHSTSWVARGRTR